MNNLKRRIFDRNGLNSFINEDFHIFQANPWPPFLDCVFDGTYTKLQLLMNIIYDDIIPGI